MTLLEKLRETNPGMVQPPEHAFHDCGKGCPGDHKVLNTDRTAKNCGLEHRENLYVLPNHCRKCWAQEYKPGPVTPNRKRQDAPAEGQTVEPPRLPDGLEAADVFDEMVALFGVEVVKNFCRCSVHLCRYLAPEIKGLENLRLANVYMSKLMELEGLENKPGRGRARWENTGNVDKPFRCTNCGAYNDYTSDFCQVCGYEMEGEV